MSNDEDQQLLCELDRCLCLSSRKLLSGDSDVRRAEELFAMGLVRFRPSVGGIVNPRIEPEKVRSAARYFRKAIELGNKKAHRYLEDI